LAEDKPKKICERCGKPFVGEGPDCPLCQAQASQGLGGIWHSIIYLVALLALLFSALLLKILVT
jgi:predicted amidophosphoribosyltransferase